MADEVKPALFLPPEVAEAALQVIAGVNPGREPQVILIAIENGSPPALVSSITPESVDDVLQFLLDNKGQSATVVHDLSTGFKGTIQ